MRIRTTVAAAGLLAAAVWGTAGTAFADNDTPDQPVCVSQNVLNDLVALNVPVLSPQVPNGDTVCNNAQSATSVAPAGTGVAGVS